MTSEDELPGKVCASSFEAFVQLLLCTFWKEILMRSLSTLVLRLKWTARNYNAMFRPFQWLAYMYTELWCTYCFALFYFIAHFILISPFLTICMPLCYVTYIICILIVLHCHWADLIRLHFTSSYALYNYYVTNKETLNLDLDVNQVRQNFKFKSADFFT